MAPAHRRAHRRGSRDRGRRRRGRSRHPLGSDRGLGGPGTDEPDAGVERTAEHPRRVQRADAPRAAAAEARAWLLELQAALACPLHLCPREPTAATAPAPSQRATASQPSAAYDAPADVMTQIGSLGDGLLYVRTTGNNPAFTSFRPESRPRDLGALRARLGQQPRHQHQLRRTRRLGPDARLRSRR